MTPMNFVKRFKKELIEVSNVFGHLKSSYVDESLARGYGFRTYAALVARLKDEPLCELHPELFDYQAFSERFIELDGHKLKAQVATETARTILPVLSRTYHELQSTQRNN